MRLPPVGYSVSQNFLPALCQIWLGLIWLGLISLGLAMLPLGIATAEEATTEEATLAERVDYLQDIRPILSDNCYACHGPNAEDREGELRLDSEESAFGEAASGELAIVVGKPEASELLRRMLSDDEDEVMPPADSGKSLKPEQIALVRQWIAQGADWQEHWSFVPPVLPELPKVRDASWPRNAIDTLILARLDREKLKPSAAAEKETLLRRVTFDLTGLPPTLLEVDAFLADSSPEAYEKVVDRLLQSPRYGEHMGRFWLDAARYGDTNGMHLDNYREMWPYRDWVIRAFNKNMPYDQFTIEQLAGDLLPEPTMEQLVASGFCRCHVTTNEGGSIEEEIYVRNVIDRVNTFGTVFQGLTFECTRCHDHKYDPLTMNDFYSMFAFFNSLDGPPMDGNVKDTKPSILVPSEEQAVEMKQLGMQFDAIASQKNKHRIGQESSFQKWCAEQQQLAGHQDAPAHEATHKATTEGLIGYYPLDLQEETLKTDKSVSNVVAASKPGQVAGGVEVVAGRYGNGCKLPNKEAYVDLGDDFNFSQDKPFSFGLWVKVPNSGSTGAILSKTKGSERGYQLLVKKGRISLFLTNYNNRYGIHVVTAEKVLEPDVWHHVFVTYDATAKAAGVMLVVDGKRAPLEVKLDSIFAKSTRLPFNSDKASLLLGRLERPRSKKHLVNGQLDELRFYDRRLSLPEIVGVMLADGVGPILAQPASQRTAEQTEELRTYFFHQFDTAFKALVDQEDQLYAQKVELQSKLPATLIYRERKEPRDAFILTRGEYDQHGEKVDRTTPGVLPPLPADAPRNRLGLARWLVDRGNPLTARVTVNRFWTQFFGIGLVKTPGDFGSQGEPPSHPKLIDWLAVDFIESGWDVKALARKIVLSNTYQQASAVSKELVERDPENRLLARGPRYRLDAEMLRDQALAVSGLLSDRVGGPSVKPPQPDGLWFSVGYSGSNTVRFVGDTEAEKLHRRTMYTFHKRTSPPPQMSTFDGPTRESCSVGRERTNTPLQALLMLNDPQYVEAARALAERVMPKHASNPEASVREMIRRCTGQPASRRTVDNLVGLFQRQLARFQGDPEAARSLIASSQIVKESKIDPQLDTPHLAAWTVIANLVLNLDEVVTKN